MSFKKMSPLLLLFVVLVILAVNQKRDQGSVELVGESGLPYLPSTAINADDIQAIDLFYGSERQGAIRLRRQNKGWLVADYFHAPVQQAKINRLLHVLTHLQGEFRSDKAVLLKNFQLESGQAFHLRIFTRSFDHPAVHLLLGKQKATMGFVRLQDNPQVYSVNSELFSILGLQPGQVRAPLVTKAWLDLQINDIAEQSIVAFELRTPFRLWQFGRSLPAGSNQTGSADGEIEQPKWVLSQPKVKFALNQRRVDAFISTLRTLKAEDFTAPNQLEAYGLQNPAYEATLIWQAKAGGLQTSIISIGYELPQQKGKRYARSGHRGPVYILPASSSIHLFLDPGQFLNLPNLNVQPESIRRLTLTLPGSTLQFDREQIAMPQIGTETGLVNWHLTHPPVDFELHIKGFKDWLQHLSTFSPDDLAPPSSTAGSAQQQMGPLVEIILANGTRFLLRLGRIIEEFPQFNALYVNAYPTPFAIARARRHKIFPSLKEILILRPSSLKLNRDDITRLSWKIGVRERYLARDSNKFRSKGRNGPGIWYDVESDQVDIDQTKVETALREIVALTAEDWIETPGEGWNGVEHSLILLLDLSHDWEIQLTFMRHNELIGLKSGDSSGLFILSEDTYTSLVEALSSLSAATTTLPSP